MPGMKHPALCKVYRQVSNRLYPDIFSRGSCLCLFGPYPLPVLQNPLHVREQFVRIERFAEILVGPQFDQIALFLDLRRGDTDDRCLRACPDALVDSKGIRLVREGSVQEDKIRRSHLYLLNCLSTIIRSVNFVSFQLEKACE